MNYERFDRIMSKGFEYFALLLTIVTLSAVIIKGAWWHLLTTGAFGLLWVCLRAENQSNDKKSSAK